MYMYLMGPDGELVKFYNSDWKAEEMTDSIATYMKSYQNWFYFHSLYKLCGYGEWEG